MDTKMKQFKLIVGVIITAFAIASPTFAASVITSANDPNLIGSTLIDFQSVTSGDYASFQTNGATFSGDNGSQLTICTSCGGSGYGDTGQSLNNRFGNSFTITFDNVVSAWGIQGGAFNNVWSYIAYDLNHNVLLNNTFSNSCCSPFFNGIAATGIKSINLISNSDWVVFDNMQYKSQSSTSSVPEPATITLLGLGFAGMASRLRKSV